MNKNLTCNQVMSLLNFFISGKINDKLKEYVESHILKCPKCRKKFEELQSVLLKYQDIKNDIIKEHSENLSNFPFIDNLSAYIDKELEHDENIKIKKLTISNPDARRYLEQLYKSQKMIQLSYEKTKSNSKFDYSKSIMSQILDGKDYTTVYFQRLILLFCILIVAIISGFVYLYF